MPNSPRAPRPASAVAALAAVTALIAGCASPTGPGGAPLAPVALAANVDLPRFMGDWYVIANIPTLFERGAHNAVDSYRLDADGSIPTTFTFRAGAPDGTPQRFGSRGFVVPGTGNAVWGQQYVWPIKADYRISYVSPDYTQTVITREKRDYVWIMARTPTITEADYQRLAAFVGAQGYDVGKLQRVPQSGTR